MKTSKKICRSSKEDNPPESKAFAKENNTGVLTKDTEMQEVNKSDTEEVTSPQKMAEQGISSLST